MTLGLLNYLCGTLGGVTSPAPLSLDYESSSNQYLSMSDANFGAYDRAKFAISVWIKRESTGSNDYITMHGSGSNTALHLALLSSDKLSFSVSTDGATDHGRLITTATYTSTSAYYHILAHYDSANATAGNRMRLWVNGVEITAFDTDTNPSTAIYNTTAGITVGDDSGGGRAFDGKMYQLAFFSGTLPDISTLYNAGSPIDIYGAAGLWSVLDVNGGRVTHDGVLNAAWTNNNSVVSSSTIPT